MPQSIQWTLVLFLAGCVVSPALSIGQATSQEPAPYIATVIVDDAAVLCGPGDEDDYAVELLERGTNVEVYKNISGWCKIRPPEGSFSWVPARHLRFMDHARRIGEITDPNAIAFIGSNLAKPVGKYKFQIRLDKGEQVAIIGEKRFLRTKEKISETWYKIDPPAGEFRWIEARYLSKPPVTAESPIVSQTPKSGTSTQVSDEPAINTQASHDEPAKQPELLPTAPSLAPAPISDLKTPAPKKKQGFRDVTPGVAANSFPDPPKNAEPRDVTPFTKQATFEAPTEPDQDAEASTPRPHIANIAAANSGGVNLSTANSGAANFGIANFDDQLAALETQLALAVASEPRDWNLATMRVQAKQLADTGATPLERGRAKLVLERISLYETHQKQALELEMSRAASGGSPLPANQPPANSKPAGSQPAAGAPWKPTESEPESEGAAESPSSTARPAPPTGSWFDNLKDAVGSGLKTANSTTANTPTHFDAQGKLQEVRSNNADVKYPPYALLDDDGKIVAFINSPVVKLDKHLGKRIGVYGRRGLHEVSRTLYVEVVEMVDLEIANRTKPIRTTFGTMK